MRRPDDPRQLAAMATAVAGGAALTLASARPVSWPPAPETEARAQALGPLDLAALAHAGRAGGVWAPGHPGPVFALHEPPRASVPGAPDWQVTRQGAWDRLATGEDARIVLRLASATVWLERDKKRRRCPRKGRRFQCAKPGWAYVGPAEDMRVDGEPTACTWAHPLEGATTIIEYPRLELDPGESLRLETALHDRAARGPGAPVHVEVWRAGERVARHTHPDRRGWRRVAIEGPWSGPLELRISTPHAGRRHFCYRIVTP